MGRFCVLTFLFWRLRESSHGPSKTELKYNMSILVSVCLDGFLGGGVVRDVHMIACNRSSLYMVASKHTVGLRLESSQDNKSDVLKKCDFM